MSEESKVRAIRLTDHEWARYKEFGGTKWLRNEIKRAERAEKRRQNAEARNAEIIKD